MNEETGLLHELLDTAEDIYKKTYVSDESWDVLRRVVLRLYYSDKADPDNWTASAEAILGKRGFVYTREESCSVCGVPLKDADAPAGVCQLCFEESCRAAMLPEKS